MSNTVKNTINMTDGELSNPLWSNTTQTTTPTERRVYDALVGADLWLTAEHLVELTGLSKPEVEQELFLLCGRVVVAKVGDSYRAY